MRVWNEQNGYGDVVGSLERWGITWYYVIWDNDPSEMYNVCENEVEIC